MGKCKFFTQVRLASLEVAIVVAAAACNPIHSKMRLEWKRTSWLLTPRADEVTVRAWCMWDKGNFLAHTSAAFQLQRKHIPRGVETRVPCFCCPLLVLVSDTDADTWNRKNLMIICIRMSDVTPLTLYLCSDSYLCYFALRKRLEYEIRILWYAYYLRKQLLLLNCIEMQVRFEYINSFKRNCIVTTYMERTRRASEVTFLRAHRLATVE